MSTLFLTFHGLTTGAYAYLVGPLLKFIYTGGETAGSRMSQALHYLGWEPGSDPTHLTAFIATLVVALVVIKGLAYFGGSYIVTAVGQVMEHRVRLVLYGRLLAVSYDHFSKIPRGDMISRFLADVAVMKFAVTHGITNLIRDSVQVIVLAGLALYLDPVLGAIALCVLPLSTLVIIRLGQLLRGRRRHAFDAYGALASVTEQSATALPVLRAFGAEGHARARFEHLSREVLKSNLHAWALQIFSSPLMELLGAAGLAATLWYAGRRIGAGDLAPEEFVSFFAAVFLLYRPIKALGDSSGQIHGGLAALDRVNEICSLPSDPPDDPDALDISELLEGIRFEQVSYAYPDAGPALREATFSIGVGETVALVGSSGSGKTTVAMLLLRLIDPDSGQIFVDDHEITQLKRSSSRGLFALVTQDPVLLHDTIEANITFGLEASEEEIVAAARAAGAHGFIASLTDGYQTSVGESGARLSGGERQRICIARALLRKPPALILDEATASVDSETEAEISASLERLMRERTTLVISHRLSTVRRADRIVVLEEGRVAAQGTYGELLEGSLRFREIFADQLSESVVGVMDAPETVKTPAARE